VAGALDAVRKTLVLRLGRVPKPLEMLDFPGICDRAPLTGSTARSTTRSASVLRFVGGSGTVAASSQLAFEVVDVTLPTHACHIRPLTLCLLGTRLPGGGPVMVGPPLAAVRTFKSLWVVSCSVRGALKAGSREGSFRPDGRTFSSCD
jgi:hypothetical protein